MLLTSTNKNIYAMVRKVTVGRKIFNKVYKLYDVDLKEAISWYNKFKNKETDGIVPLGGSDFPIDVKDFFIDEFRKEWLRPTYLKISNKELTILQDRKNKTILCYLTSDILPLGNKVFITSNNKLIVNIYKERIEENEDYYINEKIILDTDNKEDLIFINKTPIRSDLYVSRLPKHLIKIK